MNYELFLRGPEVYIPVIGLSIVITVLAYGAFPFILSRTRKNIITKRKYNFLCFGVNFLVMILFVMINGDSSGKPYLLWTWIFARIGLKRLESRGKLEGYQEHLLEENSSHTMESERCVLKPKEYFEFFPQCEKDDKQDVCDNITSEFEDKIRFCRKCGEGLIEGSRFCRKCGTEIYTENRTK